MRVLCGRLRRVRTQTGDGKGAEHGAVMCIITQGAVLCNLTSVRRGEHGQRVGFAGKQNFDTTASGV